MSKIQVGDRVVVTSMYGAYVEIEGRVSAVTRDGSFVLVKRPGFFWPKESWAREELVKVIEAAPSYVEIPQKTNNPTFPRARATDY